MSLISPLFSHFAIMSGKSSTRSKACAGINNVITRFAFFVIRNCVILIEREVMSRRISLLRLNLLLQWLPSWNVSSHNSLSASAPLMSVDNSIPLTWKRVAGVINEYRLSLHNFSLSRQECARMGKRHWRFWHDFKNKETKTSPTGLPLTVRKNKDKNLYLKRWISAERERERERKKFIWPRGAGAEYPEQFQMKIRVTLSDEVRGMSS
jgi:hypothetical protein